MNHSVSSGARLREQLRSQPITLKDYLAKLEAVLASRSELFVVARTEATEVDEIKRRVVAFREAGCDAVLADGVKSLELLNEISALVDCQVVFNQMAGGKSPVCNLTELQAHGVAMVIYSTPCLFAAQTGMENALQKLRAVDGSLASAMKRNATLKPCQEVLLKNLSPRGTHLR